MSWSLKKPLKKLLSSVPETRDSRLHGVPDTKGSRLPGILKLEYLPEKSLKLKMALGNLLLKQQEELLNEEKKLQKPHATVPLIYLLWRLFIYKRDKNVK